MCYNLDMDKFTDAHGEEFIKLTDEEVRRCFQLISGEAKPSDFKYDLIEAGLLLVIFGNTMENILKDPGIPSEYRSKTEQLIENTKSLARTFGEAGRLTGEDKP